MTPESAMRELLLAVVGGVPVVFADENGPRPATPYVQMRFGHARPFPPHRGHVDDGGNQAVVAHRDASVELQCFGTGSFELLDGVAQRLGMSTALARAESLDLAVFEIGQLKSVPVLRGQTTYEPRALLELRVRYVVALTDHVGLIESVVVTSDIAGGPTGSVSLAADLQ